jgi:hypothetical protein
VVNKTIDDTYASKAAADAAEHTGEQRIDVAAFQAGTWTK